MMKVFTKLTGTEKAELEINRHLEIEMSNGDIFRLREDNEGFLEITKEFSMEGNGRLIINPRLSNQITIN